MNYLCTFLKDEQEAIKLKQRIEQENKEENKFIIGFDFSNRKIYFLFYCNKYIELIDAKNESMFLAICNHKFNNTIKFDSDISISENKKIKEEKVKTKLEENAKSIRAVICAVAKKENDYINDWCKYHLNLGFSKIYIYDNNDADYEPIENRIDESLKDKIVIIKIPGLTQFQMKKYTEFYHKYSKNFDWAAFIDIDEFIQLNKWKNINEMLSDKIFNFAKVIRLNWVIYDDNEQIERDISIPVYEAFTHVYEKDWRKLQAKCIVKSGIPSVNFVSCHFPNIEGFARNYVCADGSIEKIGKIKISHEVEEAYIKHFMTKTISEFIKNKFDRGDAALKGEKTLLNPTDYSSLISYFFKINKITKGKLEYIKNKGYDIDEFLDNKIIRWQGKENAGDYFGVYLSKKLNIIYPGNTAITGSLLNNKSILKFCDYIWGCGVHWRERGIVITDISKYYCVRGFETLNMLKEYGDTSDIKVGDPGILASRIFKPENIKEYEYGIICHFSDFKNVSSISKYLKSNILVINMETNDIEKVLTEINKCKKIISSSLHGIIFAHSYGIPVVRMKLENATYKNEFKFKDYFSTLDIEETSISSLSDDSINNATYKYPSKEKVKELQQNIISSCPGKILIEYD